MQMCQDAAPSGKKISTKQQRWGQSVSTSQEFVITTFVSKFFYKLFTHLTSLGVLHACMYVHQGRAWCLQRPEGVSSPWTVVKNGGESPCGWGINPGDFLRAASALNH